MQTSALSSGKLEYLMRITKASLVADQVALKPDKVRRPGPDLIRCRDLCRCTSGIMRRIKKVQLHQDDASDEASRPLGIEAEVEVDDLGLRWMLEVEIRNKPKGLIAPDREL